MKTIALIVATILLAGCVSNPALTGKPQDWVGHSSADLVAAWGQPTKIIPQAKQSEVWEYVKSGEFVAPKEDNTSFSLGGLNTGNAFGASGGITTLKHDQRLSNYENIFRFMVKDGKIKKWFAARIVDGRTVWSDH